MVNTVESLFREANKYLSKEDAAALACGFFGCDRGALLLKMKNEVSSDESEIFLSFIKKAEEGMPISYILGKKEFYSLDFIVTEDTLIPRPDTETLVENIIPLAKGKRLLDICCGTGCIGITVAVNTPCILTMVDISEKALSVAKQNCTLHNINATLIKKDILKEKIEGEYDIIVSNPPYIESDVIATLDRNVRNFEPQLALDGGKTGLDFYPVISEKAFYALSIGGILAFEIGYNQGDSVSAIMHEAGFQSVRVIKDLAENDRVVIGKK